MQSIRAENEQISTFCAKFVESTRLVASSLRAPANFRSPCNPVFIMGMVAPLSHMEISNAINKSRKLTNQYFLCKIRGIDQTRRLVAQSTGELSLPLQSCLHNGHGGTT